MNSLFRIVIVSTVLALATSLPNVYNPQLRVHPVYIQEQRLSRNQPSYTPLSHNSDWSTQTYHQQQGYYPNRNYQRRNYPENTYRSSTSQSVSIANPRVKNIVIKSGHGPREFKLPLNGDPKRIEIKPLKPKSYETDLPSIPGLPSVIKDPNSEDLSNLKVFHYNPYDETNFASTKQNTGPELKDPVKDTVKRRLIPGDISLKEVDSNILKIIRLYTNDYSDGNIPESLPPAVREALKNALSSLRNYQGTGQKQSGTDKKRAKSSSEPRQSAPGYNKASRPVYRPHPIYRKPITAPTNRNSPTQNRELQTYDSSVPDAWRPRYQPLTKDKIKSIDNNKYSSPIMADQLLSSDESDNKKKYLSQTTRENSKKAIKSQAILLKDSSKSSSNNFSEATLTNNEMRIKSNDLPLSPTEAVKAKVIFLSNTNESNLDDSTEALLTLDLLSITENYKSSSLPIPDNFDRSSTSPALYKKDKYVNYKKLTPTDPILSNNESVIQSKHLSPSLTEAFEGDVESQAVLSDIEESSSDNFTDTSLTFEFVTTTDNYDPSSAPNSDNWKSISLSPALYKKKPIDSKKRSNPLIPADTTLSDDEADKKSEDLSPSLTEAFEGDVESQAVLSDINESSSDDVTDTSLTLEPLTKTDNYDPSSAPNVYHWKSISFKSKPNDYKKRSNPLIPVDPTLSDNESDKKSEDFSSSLTVLSVEEAETEAIFLSNTNKSDFDDSTKAPLTLDPLSTADNYDSSSVPIPNNFGRSSTAPVSYKNKPVDYKRCSTPLISTDTILSDDVSDINSKNLSLSITEASEGDLESQPVLSDTNESSGAGFTDTSLTLQPVTTTSNNDPSSSPIPDDWKRISLSPASYKKQPVDYKRRPSSQISADKALSEDESHIRSEDHSPNITEVSEKYQIGEETQTILLNDTDSDSDDLTETQLHLEQLSTNKDTILKNADTYPLAKNQNAVDISMKKGDNIVLEEKSGEKKHKTKKHDDYDSGEPNGERKDEIDDKSSNVYAVHNKLDIIKNYSGGSDDFSLETQRTYKSDQEDSNQSQKTLNLSESYKHDADNIVKTYNFYSDDASVIEDTDSKQIVESEQVEDGTEKANISDHAQMRKNIYSLKDTKSTSDAESVKDNTKYLKATITFNEGPEKVVNDLLKEMETTQKDTLLAQKDSLKTIEPDEDMTPLSFTVTLIRNFFKGGDSVIKMLQEPKVQEFVTKHLPILNIQFL